jgi:hypothetical protein
LLFLCIFFDFSMLSSDMFNFTSTPIYFVGSWNSLRLYHHFYYAILSDFVFKLHQNCKNTINLNLIFSTKNLLFSLLLFTFLSYTYIRDAQQFSKRIEKTNIIMEISCYRNYILVHVLNNTDQLFEFINSIIF